jgi:hypothetical protein
VWFSKWFFFSFFFLGYYIFSCLFGIWVTIFVFLKGFFLPNYSSFSKIFLVLFLNINSSFSYFNVLPAAFDSFFIYSKVFSFKFAARFSYFYENIFLLNLDDFDELVFLSKLKFIRLFEEIDDLLDLLEYLD